MILRGDFDLICGCIGHMQICEHSLHVPWELFFMLIYSRIVHMQIRGHSLHVFWEVFLLLICGHISHMQNRENSYMHPESCSWWWFIVTLLTWTFVGTLCVSFEKSIWRWFEFTLFTGKLTWLGHSSFISWLDIVHSVSFSFST